MKKIIFSVLISAAFVITILACSDSFLESDPQTGATFDNNFFTNRADYDGYMFGAYSEIQGVAPANGADGGIQIWILVGGIMMQDITRQEQTPYLLNDYVTPSKEVTGAWKNCYKVIGRSNLILSKLQTSPGTLTEAEKVLFEGEAKFLRGFAYYSLAQRYGAAVLYLDAYNISDQAALSLARSPEVQVWDQAIADLIDAAAALPRDWDDSNVGRATKGAALSYLANAYMYKKDWANAKKASDDLIALGKYSLLPNMRNLFSYLTENTEESIFEIQFQFQPGAQINWGGQPNFGSFLNWWTGPQGIGPPYAVFNGTGQAPTNRKLADSFDPADKRRQELIKIPGESYAGETMDGQTYTIPLTIAQSLSAFNAKWWTGAASRAGIEEWFWSQNVIVMRYAEFLLNYSEILFESGDNAGAYTYLNLVRARANLAPLVVQAGRETFFTDLMKERRWELFWEPNIWYHYTRTGRAEKFLLDEYGLVMDPKWNKFPVPQSDVDLNPNLVQTAGY